MTQKVLNTNKGKYFIHFRSLQSVIVTLWKRIGASLPLFNRKARRDMVFSMSPHPITLQFLPAFSGLHLPRTSHSSLNQKSQRSQVSQILLRGNLKPDYLSSEPYHGKATFWMERQKKKIDQRDDFFKKNNQMAYINKRKPSSCL